MDNHNSEYLQSTKNTNQNNRYSRQEKYDRKRNKHRHYSTTNSGYRSPQKRQRFSEGDTSTSDTYGTTSASSGDEGDVTTTNTPHIPGFYYDPELKKYFKIGSKASGAKYTKDTIAHKQATESIESAISEHQSRLALVSVSPLGVYPSRPTQAGAVSLPCVLFHASLGTRPQVPSEYSQKSYWESIVSGWRPRVRINVQLESSPESHITSLDVHDDGKSAVIGYSNGQVIYSDWKAGSSEEIVPRYSSPVVQFSSTTTSARFHRIADGVDVVITSSLGHETVGGTLHIYSVKRHPHQQSPVVVFDKIFNFSTRRPVPIWTSALCNANCSAHGGTISLGSTGFAYVISGWDHSQHSDDGVLTQSLKMPVKTDILSQTFDSPSSSRYDGSSCGNVLYNGCRNGMVYSYDLREYSAFKPALRIGPSDDVCIYHADPVTSLHAMGTKVVTGSRSGVVHVWDKRYVTSPVLTFKDVSTSGSNMVASSPIVVHESAISLVRSVGKKSVLRSYSLTNGSNLSFVDISPTMEGDDSSTQPVLSYNESQRSLFVGLDRSILELE